MEDLKNSLSFSTMWNYMKSQNGAELLQQILDLGFHKVELNYRITGEMLQSMEPMIEKGLIRVNSIHNVFPRVDDKAFDTDSLLLGYPEPDLRKRAVELTKQAVDYARRLGARVVVIHPGEVPVSAERHYDTMLKKMYRDGLKGASEYERLFKEMQEYRERESPRYLNLIKQSLAEICDYIAAKNYRVCLGIENRAMCHQIPDFQEAHYLLNDLKDMPVYFWYDIGHGLALEALGMFNSLAEALKLKDKIIGVHIHDAIGVDDHWTPYLHSANLDKFIGIIRDIPLKVLELGAKNKAEEIRRGVAILETKLASNQI